MIKEEFEPLFSAGFHDIQIKDFEDLFVNDFVNNDRRLYLIDRLRVFLSELSRVSATFEIWLDGSFTTKKEEPDDIDLLIVYDNAELNSLPRDEQNLVRSLFNRDTSKIRYDLDILLCPNNDENKRSYWRGWFGFSRSEKPKGIVRFIYGINQ